MTYNFSLVWKAGKHHYIADALSRAPFFPPDVASEVDVFGVFQDDPALAVIRANMDDEHLSLMEAIKSGQDCPPELSAFRYVFPELKIVGETLVMGDRLIVPGPADAPSWINCTPHTPA